MGRQTLMQDSWPATDPPAPVSRRWFFLKLCLSLGILSVLLYRALGNPDIQELWRQPKQWDWWFWALVWMSTGYLVSMTRWWVVAVGADVPLRLRGAIFLGMITLPFQLISFGVAGGDLVRMYYLCRDHPDRKTRAAASVLLDRALGLWVMFGCVAVAGWLIDWQALQAADARRTAGLQAVWWVALVAVLGGFGLAATGLVAGTDRRVAWCRSAWPFLRLRGLFHGLLDLVPLYRGRPLTILTATGLSLVNVVCLSRCVYCVARGLTDVTPSWASHLLITPISLIAGAAPLPGGLGSQELVMSWMYAAFSTPENPTDYGFLVAVGYRGLTFLLMGLGLLLYMRAAWRQRRILSRP